MIDTRHESGVVPRHNPQAGVLVGGEHAKGVVGAPVVHNNELQVGVILAEHVWHGLVQPPGTIVDGHNNGHQRLIVQSISSISTVSYTHLRAHETRHDLVCRLLLE